MRVLCFVFTLAILSFAATASPGQSWAPRPTPSPDVSGAPPVAVERTVKEGESLARGGDVPAQLLPHNLSPVGMFLAADWIVKSVMIGLGAASVLTWTIVLAKSVELGGASGNARRALRLVSRARSLEDAREAMTSRRGVAALMVRAAVEERALTEPALARISGDGFKERVSSRLHRIELRAGRRLQRGTGLLATIGSVGPFVGLFGTVWGIMNAFVGISAAQTTNLAVVAPGIAEALLATAIGLVAAIPAVVFYNVFARAITGYRQSLADVSAAIERLVSRDLDFRHLAVSAEAR